MANELTFKDAEAVRDAIMDSQKREIAALYESWADEIGERAKFYSHKSTASAPVSERYYRELQNQLRATSQEISNEIYGKIRRNMYTIADAVVADNVKWLESFGFSKDGLNAAFSYVPDEIVRNLITGQIYDSGWSLSSRIWGDNEQTLKDVYQVMARGLAENKPIYEIAKDLESYVRPSARLPWNPVIAMKNTRTGEIEYKRIYKKQVDYNAQRLARTLAQHSYQQSFVATTQKNPFITEYVWISNGSRVCELCAARNGMHFKKDELPMDHPNGMCTMEPVVADDMIDKLADWFNSPDGTYPEIDEFAGNFGYTPVPNGMQNANTYSYNLYNNVKSAFAEKFGFMPNVSSMSINESDFTGLMNGTYAYVDPTNGSLHINPNVFKDEETFMNIVGNRIRAYHQNATPDSILAHEFGHNISLQCNEQKIINEAVSEYIAKHPKTGMDMYIPDYQYAAESISHYAVTTEHELFAEAFGDVYANGDNAQELSKAIVEKVRQELIK